jgi:hypothetical protein
MDRATRTARAATLAWIALAVGLFAIALELVSALSTSGATAEAAVAILSLLLVAGAFLVSGVLIATRRPGNVVGWLLIIPGLAVPFGQLASDRLAATDPVPSVATPAMVVLALVAGAYWLGLIFPIFHLLLTFPDGRLLTPRWRWLAALEGLMVGFFLCLATFSTQLTAVGPDGADLWSTANPIGFIGPQVWETISTPWTIGLLVLTIGSVMAFVLRYRRGSSEIRHQLKWPLAAIALFGVAYGLTAAFSDEMNDLMELVFVVAIIALPISVAIAVLRYHLYEIDRVISRTVSWAVVTGLLVAIFVGLVVGLQAILSDVTQGQTLAVAGSTLVAAAMANPIRLRVQRAVDRRFNRSRYDAERIVADFADRLRDEVDLVTLRAELHETTARAVEPVTTAIWLRGMRRA